MRRRVLFMAFAFAVMADPVSSVAYAIEAALRALGGDLGLLLPTMAVVVGIIALVTLNYWQLVRRFPQGGGAAEAAGQAFGTPWAFPPIGALIVDFALTISVSVAAAVSAVIAYLPSAAPARLPLDVALIGLVAGLTWFGHGGRVIFAAMTVAFIAVCVVVLAIGAGSPDKTHGAAPITHAIEFPLVAVVLAFPVAMALATGTEAPATSIAQLGQLDDDGKRRFGQGTLLLTVIIVGGLTLGITALGVQLHVGIPQPDETQIANIARASVGEGALFAAFQLASSLLLLAAASSSFQAGPGLLKALSRRPGHETDGILPSFLGETNGHHTPYWSVAVYAVISALIVLAGRGQEQELVLVYAVAVFVSFLAGLLAMARFARQEGLFWTFLLNIVAAVAVAFTLVVNLARGYPLLSVLATCGIAALLYWRWTRAGRPRGLEEIEREAETDD
jgi:hypothetical protein